MIGYLNSVSWTELTYIQRYIQRARKDNFASYKNKTKCFLNQISLNWDADQRGQKYFLRQKNVGQTDNIILAVQYKNIT